MSRRAILTKQYWREFRRDLKRSKKDKRARRGAFLRLAALAYFIWVLWFYGDAVYSVHDSGTYAILGGMATIIVVVLVGRKVSHLLDERRQFREDLAATPSGTAERLQRLALGELAITERALSELWLSRYTLPEGFEVRTRRIQIDKLREARVWDEMPSDARQWMMRPDGDWTIAISLATLSGAESLHTLLWALFLIQELRSLDELAKPLPFAVIAKTLRRTARGVRPTWDLRVARNDAHIFFTRCYAEHIHRGTTKADDENQQAAITEWMTGINEGNIADSFAGDLTIAELDATSLDQVGRSSARRMVTLDAVLQLMDGVDAWSRLTELVYGSFVGEETSTEEPEAASS